MMSEVSPFSRLDPNGADLDALCSNPVLKNITQENVPLMDFLLSF